QVHRRGLRALRGGGRPPPPPAVAGRSPALQRAILRGARRPFVIPSPRMPNPSKTVLGIDIGGTGIKAALVDTKKGKLASRRHRVPTPQPATPEAVAEAVAGIAQHFRWEGRLGCTVPAR